MADGQSGRSGITLVALLYLHPGSDDAFGRFESAASRIMARYGGRIERRIRIAPTERSADERSPDEIHVVRFPDEASFASYRADPELRGLGELRASAIRETVIWRGDDAAPFRSS